MNSIQFFKVVCLLFLFVEFSFAQSTIITPGSSGAVRVPNLTYEQINAISSPQPGMVVYDITFRCLKYYNGSTWVCSNPSEISNTGTAINIGGLNTDFYPSMDASVDGSIFVGGSIWNNNTYFNTPMTAQDVLDGFLAKVNSNLTLSWIKHFTGVGENSVLGVRTDNSGNVYIYGTFKNTVVLDGTTLTSTNPTPNYPDRFLAKFNAAGTLIWTRKIEVFSDFMNIFDFKVIDSGIYLSGNFRGTVNYGSHSISAPGYDSKTFIIRFDLNGNSQSGILGGENTNAAYIDFDSFGNIYMAGYYYTSTNFGSLNIVSAGSMDLYVAKFNISSGSWERLKTYGSSGYEICGGLTIDKNNNLYISGNLGGQPINFDGITINSSSNNSTEAFCAKFDVLGTAKWIKKISGYGRIRVVPSNSSDVFIYGELATYSSNPMVSFDNISTTTGLYDPYISKYTTEGTSKWFSKFGGTGYDYLTTFRYKNNKMYILGSYESMITIGTSTLFTSGSQMYLGVLFEP